MSDDLIKDIESAVANDINALGPNPHPDQIADIVATHARLGAGDNSVIADQAADRARQYYGERGIEPETASSMAGAQAHQDVVSSRPSVQEQAHDLLNQRPPGSQGPANADDVQQYTDIPIDGETKKTMNQVGEALTKSGSSPELAAQAQLAIANAASGGEVLPAGLDIHGKLKVTVHDVVDLTYQNSQIKTTVGDTTYVHKADVNIEATNVRLTANEIVIEPLNKETNWVKESKKSYRSIFSVSVGLSSTTTTTAKHKSYFGATATAVPSVSISYAPVRIGAAFRMATRAARREGIQAITYENTDGMTRKSNVFLWGVSVLLIFI